MGRPGGEGAKFWMSVLTDLRNRGVRDVFFVVCDGLKGLPDVVGNVWPATIVQTCIIHLIRNTFRFTSRGTGMRLKRDVRPIYTAVNAAAAGPRSTSSPSGGVIATRRSCRLWDNAWDEFIPFLDYDIEIRRVLCSTNAIESLERPLPASDQSPRSLPIRAGRAEVPLPRDQIPGPHREGSATMGDTLEASPQRVLDHVRRPLPSGRDLLTNNAEPTVNETVSAYTGMAWPSRALHAEAKVAGSGTAPGVGQVPGVTRWVS